MLHHKSCLEAKYRDLDVGFEAPSKSAEILQGARGLWIKILRGDEEFSIFSVFCHRCGTPISLEDTAADRSDCDRYFYLKGENNPKLT